MALQKEIWLADIIEPLYAQNTFAAQSVDHSAFVNGAVVHVPNAGNPPEIVKNRSTFPATAKRREDTDLTYTLNDYSTDPVHIPNADAVELSYDKRQSVLGQIQLALADKVHEDLLKSWIDGAGISKPLPAGTSHKTAIMEIAGQFNKQDIPQEGRFAVVDAIFYANLLRELTDFEGQSFLASANAQTGALGRLYGLTLYQRSTLKDGSNDDIFAWHKGSVSRALGQTEIFVDDQNPLYYGDIFSALVRAGGAVIRSDKAGTAFIHVAAE